MDLPDVVKTATEIAAGNLAQVETLALERNRHHKADIRMACGVETSSVLAHSTALQKSGQTYQRHDEMSGLQIVFREIDIT